MVVGGREPGRECVCGLDDDFGLGTRDTDLLLARAGRKNERRRGGRGDDDSVLLLAKLHFPGASDRPTDRPTATDQSILPSYATADLQTSSATSFLSLCSTTTTTREWMDGWNGPSVRPSDVYLITPL